MTIAELIDLLNEYRDILGDDAEVRLMTQPAWPFENAILGVASGHEIMCADAENDGEEMDDDDDPDAPDPVLYIVEEKQLAYGTKTAWLAARRS
jgi:hypothetical protein